MVIRNEEDLGHILREWRRRRGMNQTELGIRAGLRQKTVSDAELGNPISTRTLFAVLAALGLELNIGERAARDIEPEAF